MKLTKVFFCIIIVFILGTSVFGKIHQVKRSDYLKYAIEAAEDYWKTYDEDAKKWVERIDLKYVFGYNPPGNVIYLAFVNAQLFKITSEEKYAKRARKCLLEIGDFRKHYPKDFWNDKPGYENGVPAVGNFFTTPMYIKAYQLLKETKYLSKKNKEIITENIAQEWGAMNRGVLRAEVFHLAAITLPDHPHAKTWEMISESIVKDCWGTWEIEDAPHYNAIYLYSLFSLVDFLDEKSFYQHAVTRYTMQFYSHLIAPHGMIPDFGDSHFNSNWRRWVAVFEKSATVYNDPELKYAANRIANKLWDWEAKRKSMWSAVIAIDCYRWADDGIAQKEPQGKSELVLDDVVGKKIVFRTGYKADDTYMLVNYKDEGIAGFMSREYLRRSIPVEEEKMTHGHSDENDIPLDDTGLKGEAKIDDTDLKQKVPARAEAHSGGEDAQDEDQKVNDEQQKGDDKDAQIEELTGALARAMADLQNYKRRTEEEQGSFVKFANAELLKILLPVIDNFDRSAEHMPDDLKGNDWAKGVVQIHDDLLKTLEKAGVKRIKTVGEKLNPNLHEGLIAGPGKKDEIIEEFEPGYTLNDNVIKPAKVKVGDGT